MMTFDLNKNVNPHFRPVWHTKVPYNVLRGGRNSFKSTVVALKLSVEMLKYIQCGERANVVIMRKVGASLRDSVFNQVQEALDWLGARSLFKSTVSPLRLTETKTGSTFYFYGQDDFQKLKSNKVNDLIGVWYEEAAEFKDAEDFDQTNSTFVRQKHKDADRVLFFWTYNPPRNPYSWINEWAEKLETASNYLVHKSSYLDDTLGIVNEQMLEEIERIKANDYDYYRYMYLGEPVGLGTNVYNMDNFNRAESIPSDERPIGQFFAMDTGHMQSATTCLHVVMTNKKNIYLIDNYYYSPHGLVKKKAPSILSVEINKFVTDSIKKFPNVPVANMTIDSAEGAIRNQYFEDYGVRWNPVAKKKKIVMTEFVQSLLADGRFYYLPSANNLTYFIEEHKKYQWDAKSVMNDDPRVVKEDDHTCDAFMYFVVDNAQILELKA